MTIEWSYYHPKLGMGKINPIERPLQPNGPPATNEPRKEKIIKNPQAPVTSYKQTAAELISSARQKEELMSTKTADAASGAPEVATPDARVDVTGVGSVLDGSNEAASKADAQVDVTGIGATPADEVGPDAEQSIEQSAAPGSDDAGYNEDKTSDDSGPTMTWDVSYGDGSAVEQQHEPVTSEPFPDSDEGVKKSNQHIAYDSDNSVSDDGGLSGGSANEGTQPADPIGKADDRVDVLKAVATPENNSGPTKTWSGTDGNGVEKQLDPVTNETVEDPDGVKHSNVITSHIVKAMKLADLEIELGLASPEDKYTRLAQLGNQSEQLVDIRLATLSQVKTAGLKKASMTRGAGRMPSFKMASAAPQEKSTPIMDEALFL